MSKRKYPGVYRIICETTSECYVGSTAYLTDRRSLHFQQLRRGVHANIHLQRAFNKYGEVEFLFEVLEKPPIEELIEREQHWIDTLKPAYNIRKIAESNLGLKTSEETKTKRRQWWDQLPPEERAKTKQTLAEGRRKRLEMIASGEYSQSPETIALIKAARAKQETTPAMLEALKQGQEVRKQVNPKPRLGMTNSEEMRRKQSEAAKQRGISPETQEKMRAAKRGKGASAAMLAANRRIAEERRGHTVSEETCKKIAQTNRATWAKKSAEEKHWYTQKRPPVSQETRQKQSEAAKRRRNRAS